MTKHSRRGRTARLACGAIILSLVAGCASDGSSTLDENKLVVRRFLEDVVSTGDVAILPELVAPEYFETADPQRLAVGVAGAREHVLGVREVYPDLRVTVEQQIAEGEWVATRITARGTHRGAWLGMAPTGRVVEITGVNLDRVVDGRIVEHGGAANLLMPLLEIGAIETVETGRE